MVRIVGASVGDVVQHIIAIQLVSFGHGQQSFRTKCALGIDVQTFSFTATLTDRKLDTVSNKTIKYIYK